MLAAVLIVRILRLGKENLVKHIKAAHIAGAHAEHDEIFAFFSCVYNLNGLSLRFEIHQIFRLREEEILCTADGIERL